MHMSKAFASRSRILFIGCAIFLTAQAGFPQSRYTVENKETIRRTLEFSGTANHMIELNNINGSIHVTNTTGRNVEVVADKTIRAESQDRVEAAKQEVKLDISDKLETVRVYVDSPSRCNCGDGREGWRSSGGRWSDPGYRVNIDFDVRVPPGTRLRLRTVNGGDITVDGTTGDFEVENINGRIIMSDIRGSGSAATVNGPVKVSFLENPKTATSFKSTNGVIEVSFQPNLSANLQMKTFNGGLYTDFDVQYLPSAPVTGERVTGKFIYRGNQFTGFRVGNGGPEIKFDGFNGDVKVLRRTR